MKWLAIVVGLWSLASAQVLSDGSFAIALTEHKGRLKWSADGFKIVQASAKPGGKEIGLRGRNSSGQATFLGFLFLVPEGAPLTSAKCRDEAVDQERKGNSSLKILGTSQVDQPNGLPVALVSYTSRSRDGSTLYVARGFVATGDICGDLEFYSATHITAEDPEIMKMLSSLKLESDYRPVFSDMVLYGQIQYQTHDYKSAAATFEKALASLPPDGAPFPSARIARRVITDQAGMSYGIAGDVAKARAMFEKAITDDPDYPMYYYNLACADAGENKLADARHHLEQAFARRGNTNPGEAFPDPTKDTSFTPYRSNKEFWAFVQNLH